MIQSQKRQKKIKSVVWIDPNFTLSSPIMQRFIKALPYMKSKGWRIEVWTSSIDSKLAGKIDHVCMIPSYKNAQKIIPALSFFQLHCFLKWLNSSQESIYHSVKGSEFYCDVVSWNFSHLSWVKKMLSLKNAKFGDFARLLLSFRSIVSEALSILFTQPKLIIANSEELTALVKDSFVNETNAVFLPNQIDAKKFSSLSRRKSRKVVRDSFSYSESDCVLAFVSQGHLLRKGWYDLVESLVVIRKEKKIQLLNIGIKGYPLVEAKKFLEDKGIADWEGWIVFAEGKTRVEEQLAAADGFVFPSHFDSSANVVSESFAMGIPVFVGNYFGAKHYLGGKSNASVMLNSDHSDMNESLKKFIFQLPSFHSGVIRNAVSPEEWAKMLEALYCENFSFQEE